MRREKPEKKKRKRSVWTGSRSKNNTAMVNHGCIISSISMVHNSTGILVQFSLDKNNNNELLSKAVKYYLNHKDELYTFLECGYVDISNNLAERVVKVFVIARKSFLFCKTADGATTTGKLFSLVQTARANGLKSEQYIAYVISNINKKDINDLLPWSDKLPKELLISSK